MAKGARWDGGRAVDVSSGETIYRVSGDRVVDLHTGNARYRLRPDDGHLVDAASGALLFLVRADGRVIAANCGALVMRLHS